MTTRPRLSDPWFEAKFYGGVGEIAPTVNYRYLDSIEGAQGVWLWCPCGYGKPEYPLDGPRPHAIVVPFSNPRNAPPSPSGHGPFSKKTDTRPRWVMNGTSLEDLTCSPSVDVAGGVGGASCWHGFISHGEIR